VITDSYTYFAFGQLKASTGTTTNRYTWVGELGYSRDLETGEYALGVRQYLPDRARFKSEDPLGLGPDANPFRYCQNGPLLWTDPSGLGPPDSAVDPECDAETIAAKKQQIEQLRQDLRDIPDNTMNYPKARRRIQNQITQLEREIAACTVSKPVAPPPTKTRTHPRQVIKLRNCMLEDPELAAQPADSKKGRKYDELLENAYQFPLLSELCKCTDGKYDRSDDRWIALLGFLEKLDLAERVAIERGYASNLELQAALAFLVGFLVGLAASAAVTSASGGFSVALLIVAIGAAVGTGTILYYRLVALVNLLDSATTCEDIDEAAQALVDVAEEILTTAAGAAGAATGSATGSMLWRACRRLRARLGRKTPVDEPDESINRKPDTPDTKCDPSTPPPNAKGLYSDLTDPPGVAAGKDFTAAQKAEIIAANKARNGGVVKSDLSGEVLTQPAKSRKGVTPPSNEWQIDHIVSKNKCGTNSYSNAQVLSRAENRAKYNK
jgi:RHS repeat-associated protein